MSCPTCSHTMSHVGIAVDGASLYHCPRCGTLRRVVWFSQGQKINDDVPMLVGRCREFGEALQTIDEPSVLRSEWGRLGVWESINTPEDRS